MPDSYAPASRRDGLRALGVAVGIVLILAGCARQRSEPKAYDPILGASSADATSQARDAYKRGVVNAPSQLQLDLKANKSPGVALTARGHAAIIAQAQTFLGTLPCFQPGLNCEAQRLTLTLAPNGRWRARVGYLNASRSADVIEQGCWYGTPERPARIMLTQSDASVRAEFALVQSNMLRVRTVNGQAPSLAYHLTRQPDLDPIDTPTSSPAPVCE